jgi:hypothetical protein
MQWMYAEHYWSNKLQINVTSNITQVQAAVAKAASQVPFALSTALNKIAAKAKDAIRSEMPKVFDRPTPWVLNSLRIKYASKSNISAELAYKDKNSVESARSMIEPHVFAGRRHHKAMEARLLRMGFIPTGYSVVPGAAAKLDGNGNMSQGQISQLLNVLGAYTESGFNKANINTVKRLAKGNAKKNIYGFVYWVNKVDGAGRNKKIPPGIYQRVVTGFGTSLKPILIFVKQAQYKKRLDFFGLAGAVVDKEFPGEFDRAFDEAMRTSLLKQQGSLL